MVDRIFSAKDRNGIEQEFELGVPNMSIENEGERHYRIAYSNCLKEGIFPKEKLRELMREHEMWTDQDDSDLSAVVGKIAVLQIDLRNKEADGSEKECLEIAKKIIEARERMWQLFLVQQSVYMNSAEGVSEMIKTECIMAACTKVKSTGQRYWKDYGEFVRERDFNEKSEVYANVVNLQARILDEVREGLTEDYPEQKYAKSVEERILDREVEEQVVRQLNERMTKSTEEKPKRKTTKKKTVRKKKTSGRKVAVRSKKTTS